jgi:hypothetical protein
LAFLTNRRVSLLLQKTTTLASKDYQKWPEQVSLPNGQKGLLTLDSQDYHSCFKRLPGGYAYCSERTSIKSVQSKLAFLIDRRGPLFLQKTTRPTLPEIEKSR